jgi:uncharacterized damage-inducible protein DinB
MTAAMNRLAHHLATLAHNNAWANHRMLGAVMQLSQDAFHATRTSFFPSLKATLNHIVTVDWYYVDALERSLRGATCTVRAALRLARLWRSAPARAAHVERKFEGAVAPVLVDSLPHVSEGLVVILESVMDLELGQDE